MFYVFVDDNFRSHLRSSSSLPNTVERWIYIIIIIITVFLSLFFFFIFFRPRNPPHVSVHSRTSPSSRSTGRLGSTLERATKEELNAAPGKRLAKICGGDTCAEYGGSYTRFYADCFRIQDK